MRRQPRYTNAPQTQASDFTSLGTSQGAGGGGLIGGLLGNYLGGLVGGAGGGTQSQQSGSPQTQSAQSQQMPMAEYTSFDSQSPIEQTSLLDRYGPEQAQSQPEPMGYTEQFLRSGQNQGLVGGLMNYAANQFYGQQQQPLQPQAMGNNEYYDRMKRLTGGY